jgi:hypothetical protein
MRRTLERITNGLPSGEDALLAAGFFGGLAAIAAGVTLIYPQAGLIVGGALAAGAAVLYARNQPPRQP